MCKTTDVFAETTEVKVFVSRKTVFICFYGLIQSKQEMRKEWTRE
jgi:hypothetical protein